MPVPEPIVAERRRRRPRLGGAVRQARAAARAPASKAPGDDARRLPPPRSALAPPSCSRARSGRWSPRRAAAAWRELRRSVAPRASPCRAFSARASSTAAALRSSPATLDPRPDSETLIEAALALVDARGLARAAAAHPRRRHGLGVPAADAAGRAAACARASAPTLRDCARCCRCQRASLSILRRIGATCAFACARTRWKASKGRSIPGRVNPPYIASGRYRRARARGARL